MCWFRFLELIESRGSVDSNGIKYIFPLMEFQHCVLFDIKH